MRTLSFLTAGAWLALTGCSPDEVGSDGHVTIDVDTTITPNFDTLGAYADGTPRPVAAMVDQDGYQVDFVEDELVVASNDDALVADIAARWGGEVVDTVETEDGDRLPDLHVIRIDPERADPEGLEDDLVGLVELAFGGLTFSSEAGRGLFAAAAAEATDGTDVMVNWLTVPSGFEDRVAAEAPGGPVGYSPNPFTWSYMDDGSTQDLGVGEAWRGLHLQGSMQNTVKVAVIDQGFVPNDDFPPNVNYSAGIGLDAVGVRDFTHGGWHGTTVVEVGFGQVDNNYGVAGPGGPVTSELVTIQYGMEPTSCINAILMARGQNVDIINMSFGVRVPTIVAWTMYPFEWATMDAWDDGILVFAAAGNEGENVDAVHRGPLGFNWGEKAWHAPCENNAVICVGGLEEDSVERHDKSNYGSEHVDIFGPFWTYTGPTPDSAYEDVVGWGSGTSFASPFVAGVAALVWAADPTMSNDAVWSRLRLTAHDSPDDTVRRIVDAEEAVLPLFEEGLPWVEITSPPEGSEWPSGWPVPLQANAFDFEDGPIETVVWSSNQQSLIGAGTATEVDDLIVGTHLINALVFDVDGNLAFDEVEIEVTNEDPEVTLLEPLDGAQYVVGELVHVRASSFDFNENPTMALPDSAMSWDSSLDGVLGTGHESDIILGEGTHVLTVTGTDAAGAIATDSISLDVVPGFDFGPVVTITTPPEDVDSSDADWLDWQYDGYDTAAGMMYKDVLLIGSAVDPEDGTLSGASMVWTTDRTDLQPALLGTGQAFVVRLYGTDPCGVTHEILLEATDSYGNVRPAVRIIRIWAVC